MGAPRSALLAGERFNVPLKAVEQGGSYGEEEEGDVGGGEEMIMS